MIRRRHCTEPTAGDGAPRKLQHAKPPEPPPLVHQDADVAAHVLGLLLVFGGGGAALFYLACQLLGGQR